MADRTDDRQAPTVAATSMRQRLVDRTLAAQRAQATDEVDRIVDATYRVMAAQGSIEPRVRDILEEAGVSTQAFYRHFGSKDELLLVILDDGRQQLAGYLAHRMEKVRSRGPEAQVRAWIEGMLAQATDVVASTRTRPFLARGRRLTEMYPEQQEISVGLLVDLLADAVAEGAEAGVFQARNPRRSASYVYRVAVGVMEEHVLAATAPKKAEIDDVVGFCLRALAA